jgi:hypothetical protein
MGMDVLLEVIAVKKFFAGHRWLTPVILAAQEAEIRQIMVRSQHRQIVPQDLSSKKNPPQQ